MTDIVDLRSDTVTKPSAEMRTVMANAIVGDDVLGDDPTVIQLQERMAEILGKEAALYVPSGSMANQVAIRSVCEPGDEIILDETTHSYNYEVGAPSALSGCSIRPINGERGVFTVGQMEAGLRPPGAHFARSRMVIVENTNNRGGGRVWPLDDVATVCTAARKHGLHIHLDGARLMNACVAQRLKPTEYTRHVDSVSMCFSKGLGAPVGSIVAGTKPFIERCHRFRKMFGGGMRQAGILAAACLYALDHNIERMAEDHANAKCFAEGIAKLPGIKLDVATVETNIVIFEVDATVAARDKNKERPPSAGSLVRNPELAPAPRFAEMLKERGVWMFATGATKLRAVTHLDVSREQIDRALDVFAELIARPATT